MNRSWIIGSLFSAALIFQSVGANAENQSPSSDITAFKQAARQFNSCVAREFHKGIHHFMAVQHCITGRQGLNVVIKGRTQMQVESMDSTEPATIAPGKEAFSSCFEAQIQGSARKVTLDQAQGACASFLPNGVLATVDGTRDNPKIRFGTVAP